MGLNMNENWFEIVEILRNTLDSNYSKAEFVSAVENCFRVLGWRKTNGSLIKNYNLPNGSNVDIVLSKTYGGNVQSDYIPVFIQCGEFQYNETDNVNFAMDELLTEAAISFGSCIKFFYRNNQDIILSKEILLEESNHEGIQISELLLFQHFKKSLVHDYITKVSHPLKHQLFSFSFVCLPPYPLTVNTCLTEVMQTIHILRPIFPTLQPLQGFCSSLCRFR